MIAVVIILSLYLLYKCRLNNLHKLIIMTVDLLVEHIFDTIRQLNRQGMTILLVEQNAHKALKIAHRGYVLQTGSIVLAGTGEELLRDETVREAYLG